MQGGRAKKINPQLSRLYGEFLRYQFLTLRLCVGTDPEFTSLQSWFLSKGRIRKNFVKDTCIVYRPEHEHWCQAQSYMSPKLVRAFEKGHKKIHERYIIQLMESLNMDGYEMFEIQQQWSKALSGISQSQAKAIKSLRNAIKNMKMEHKLTYWAIRRRERAEFVPVSYQLEQRQETAALGAYC